MNEVIEAGPNRVGLKHALGVMLEADTIEHLDWLARVLSNQRGQEMSRSEAIAFLVERNWMSMHKKLAAKQQERAVRKANAKEPDKPLTRGIIRPKSANDGV